MLVEVTGRVADGGVEVYGEAYLSFRGWYRCAVNGRLCVITALVLVVVGGVCTINNHARECIRSWLQRRSWSWELELTHQAYHSSFNDDPSVRQVGNTALLPINTKIRGPAPIAGEWAAACFTRAVSRS